MNPLKQKSYNFDEQKYEQERKQKDKEIQQQNDLKTKNNKKLQKEKEITSEEFILDQNISQVEIISLQTVFKLLCSVTQELSQDQQQNEQKFNFQDNQSITSQQQQQQTNNFQNQEDFKDYFTYQDVLEIVNQLNYSPSKKEIESMIWDIDDSMTGKINWYEFLILYKRCSLDENQLEHTELYRIIQFLMYIMKNSDNIQHHQQNFNAQKSNKGKQKNKPKNIQISSDEITLQKNNKSSSPKNQNQKYQYFVQKEITFDNALELLFVRYGKDELNQKIYDIFGVVMDSNISYKNNEESQQLYAKEAFEKKLSLEQYINIVKKLEISVYQTNKKQKIYKYSNQAYNNQSESESNIEYKY